MTSNTLVLDTTKAPCNISSLCTLTYDCGCDYMTPISDYVVTTQHGAVSVVHKVVEIAKKAVAAVKSAAVKVGKKVRSAWNWFKAKAKSVAANVKSGLSNAWSFTVTQAAAAAIAVFLGCSLAKKFVQKRWNRTKTFCRNLYASAKAKGFALYLAVLVCCYNAGAWCGSKAVQLAAWTKAKWNIFLRIVELGWAVAKPYCARFGKIALVAAALYLLATAGLLVCCVVVAALGVHAFEQVQKFVAVRYNTESFQQQQKSFSLNA